MSNPAALLARYRSFRQTQRALHSSLLKHIDKRAIQKCARKIGIPVVNNVLMFDSNEEMNLLMDYCIYDHRDIPTRGKPKNAVEKLLAMDPPPEGSQELLVLKACAQAFFTLLVINGAERGVGVRTMDALRATPVFLFDIGLSETAIPGMGIAGRFMEVEGVFMSTGAMLPFDRETGAQLIPELMSVVGKRSPEEVAHMAPFDCARLSAAVIRCCRQNDMILEAEYR